MIPVHGEASTATRATVDNRLVAATQARPLAIDAIQAHLVETGAIPARPLVIDVTQARRAAATGVTQAHRHGIGAIKARHTATMQAVHLRGTEKPAQSLW